MPAKTYLTKDDIEPLTSDIHEIKRHLLGNGQPGMLERLAKVEVKLEEVEDFTKFLKNNWPKILLGAAGLGALAEAVGWVDVVKGIGA